MKKIYKILLYENDKILNSILIKQLSYFDKYEIFLIDDKLNLLKIIHKRSFDGCIINSDELEEDLIDFIKKFQDINKHNNIILYHDSSLEKLKTFENSVVLLKKPFRLKKLFHYLKEMENDEKINKLKIYLMENLVFLPFQKLIENRNTNIQQHLTEKESNLLKFIYQSQNSQFSKKNILTSVWGINQDVDTHTLETHLYRLKQKLYKIEPKLNFSLINQNGNYIFKGD